MTTVASDQPSSRAETPNVGKASATKAVPRYNWRYLVAAARPHRRHLLRANALAILAVAASVPLPLLLPMLVDEVLLEQPGWLIAGIQSVLPTSWHAPVVYIAAVLVLTLLLRSCALLLNVWQSREFTKVSKDIVYRMREELLQRLRRVALSEYETMGSGAVANHFVTDLETVDQFIGESLSKLIVATLSLVGAAAILLWMHWQLALLILVLNPLVIYFTTRLGKQVKRLKNEENSAFSAFQQALIETLDGIQQIRASNREQHYLARLVTAARDVRDHSIRFAWKREAAGRLSFVLFLFGIDCFRAAAMLMVLLSDLSIGQMFAVFGYLWFMMAPVQEILGIQYAGHAAAAALNRLNGLWELKLEPQPQLPVEANPFAGATTVAIDIADLRFHYQPELPILNGVSLHVAAGETVALVGASGGGKSTLVQLLLGLYQPNAGSICYGATPMPSVGLDTIREHVAVVLQHPVLFNDTVRANLTLGREVDDSALWQALGDAVLADTVKAMPNGLDSVVGRQGIRLSGGQRQRLAIARMLLAKPSVVILDEATSALDAETERGVMENLRRFLADRTTIIVAHRLSAVKDADQVYVFDDGEIAESGPPQALLQQNGLYARLYGRLQTAKH